MSGWLAAVTAVIAYVIGMPVSEWVQRRRIEDRADAIANDAYWAAIRIPQQRKENQ